MRQSTTEVDKLKLERETHLRATKGRFNLFKILRKPHEEVGLHTPFLAYLLNPQGEHDCGALFLDLFFETVLKQPLFGHYEKGERSDPKVFSGFDYKRTAVRYEIRFFKEGQLDIIIECGSWGAIVIENKIYAGDHKDQIDGYFRCLKEQYIGRGRRGVLLYLTLDGDQCTNYNPSETTYFRVSYREHILTWLEACMEKTYKYSNLNYAIQQYQAVVYGLVFGVDKLEDGYMERMEDVVRDSSLLFKHWNDINKAIELLREKYFHNFIEGLQKELGMFGIDLDNLPWIDCGYKTARLKRGGEDLSALNFGLRLVYEPKGDAHNFYLALSIDTGFKQSEEKCRSTLEEMEKLLWDNLRRNPRGTNSWRCCANLCESPLFSHEVIGHWIENKEAFQSDILKVAENICKYIQIMDSFKT